MDSGVLFTQYMNPSNFHIDKRAALSLFELNKRNTDRFNTTANNSRVFAIRPRKNMRRFIFLVRGRETYSNPDGHIVSILYPQWTLDELTSQTRTKTTSNTKCKVHCTCEAFKYWGCAYNVTQENSIISGKEENLSPDIRDPSNNHLLCKHLIRVSKNIKRMSFKKLHAKFRQAHEVNSRGRSRTSSLYNEAIRAAQCYDDSAPLMIKPDLSNFEDFLEERDLICHQ